MSLTEVQGSWRLHTCIQVSPGGYKFSGNSSNMFIRQIKFWKAAQQQRHVGTGKLEGSTRGSNKWERDSSRQEHVQNTDSISTCPSHRRSKWFSLPPKYVLLPYYSFSIETQIKRTVRYHFILVRIAIVIKSTNNKCWRRCGAKGTLLHCWWEHKLAQSVRSTV